MKLMRTAVVACFCCAGVAITVGCAALYKTPRASEQDYSAESKLSKSALVASAKTALVSSGFQIMNADDSAGVISTAVKNQRLTPQQADYGTAFGIDYLLDNRTTTRVGYGVVVRNGKASVKANIEGEYKVGSSDQDLSLSCVSRGVLEKDMLFKIATQG